MKNIQKKGISLIVLVITIIIMIILAGAIILALNNSGIIGRAEEARDKNDNATIKEAANVAYAEWSLEHKLGNTNKSATEFVQERLNKQGFNGNTVAVTEDGKLLIGLTESAVNAIKAGIKIGDYVEYTPNIVTSENPYNTDGSENNGNVQSFTTQTDLRWQYLGINNDGNLLLVSDKETTSKLSLCGAKGFLNSEAVLNTVCNSLYSSNVGDARSINLSYINEVLNYNGAVGSYFSKIENKAIQLTSIKTIGELVSAGEPALTNTNTPDGSNINTWKADYYSYTGSDYKDVDDPAYKLIFINPTTSSNMYYWIADKCAGVRFNDNDVGFCVRFINGDRINGMSIYFASEDPTTAVRTSSYAMRPVVILNDNVMLEKQQATGYWTIK